MKKPKYRLPGDPISADDLPWWHELIRAGIFAAALIVITCFLFGVAR